MVQEPHAASLGLQGRVCPRREGRKPGQVPQSEDQVVPHLLQVQLHKPISGIFVTASRRA